MPETSVGTREHRCRLTGPFPRQCECVGLFYLNIPKCVKHKESVKTDVPRDSRNKESTGATVPEVRLSVFDDRTSRCSRTRCTYPGVAALAATRVSSSAASGIGIQWGVGVARTGAGRLPARLPPTGAGRSPWQLNSEFRAEPATVGQPRSTTRGVCCMRAARHYGLREGYSAEKVRAHPRLETLTCRRCSQCSRKYGGRADAYREVCCSRFGLKGV